MARKIASEGRKLRLGLLTITRRPEQVSKYVISQMNIKIMFRTINKNDLDIISTYVEYAGKDTINILPSLPTGVCVVSGIGITFPMVVEIK
jgi:DNA helicase HerA-like ATPase